MEFLLWFSIGMIVFTYFGYPLSLWFLNKIFGVSPKGSVEAAYNVMATDFSVSIIIAAANEEGSIKGKLLNTLDLDYGNINQIIVSLDGSTDDTDVIVREMSLEHPEILLLNNPKGGKEAAQKAALDHVTGDIVVFTDVSTELQPNTIHLLVRHFYDCNAGAVDGMSKVRNEITGEGLYLKYENKIRELESSLGGLVTLGGCLFAVRADIVKANYNVSYGKKIPGFSPVMQSDFRTALMAKTASLDTDFKTALHTKTCRERAILDRDAVALFDDTKSGEKEYKRKVRTVVRGINVFFKHLYLLNVAKYGIFSYQLFCHKLLKWLVPFFMITTFVANFSVVTDDFLYFLMFAAQSSCYGYYFGYCISPNDVGSKLGRIVIFFMLSNRAILRAWYEYAKGERYVSWEPTKR